MPFLSNKGPRQAPQFSTVPVHHGIKNPLLTFGLNLYGPFKLLIVIVERVQVSPDSPWLACSISLIPWHPFLLSDYDDSESVIFPKFVTVGRGRRVTGHTGPARLCPLIMVTHERFQPPRRGSVRSNKHFIVSSLRVLVANVSWKFTGNSDLMSDLPQSCEALITRLPTYLQK
jgi:hypothetical protein